ncbi:diguanylate cyclase domain-containing protein [Sulfurospirillum sp. 1612]|uniref:diguanylate cyclase domain-containing protein n=1 Tax=Sulfurospirillum sp. 1612 TaxID=3094835 RepID=UPI002F954FEE
MEYENQLFVIIIILSVLLLYVFFNSKIKLNRLEKRLYDESESERFLDILPLPIFYETKHNRAIFTNKSFNLLFGINKKKALETLSLPYRNPIEKITFLCDNDIKKQLLVYSAHTFDANKNITATIRTLVDIDEMQHVIDNLLATKQRYGLAVDHALFGVWDWDILKDTFDVSAQWKHIMGYQEDEAPKNLNAWLRLVAPKNMAHINEAIRRHLDGESELFIAEHEVKSSQGRKWVQIRGKAIRDAHNQATRFSGLIFDITEEKQKDIQHHQSQKLFASFMDSLPAIAFIKDINHRYIYLNSFYQDYIGFKEWKNKTPHEIFDKKTADSIVENDRKAFYEGQKQHAEVIPNAEGTLKYFRAYKFAIDAGNDEKFICGFGIDSTKEKLYLDEINLYSKIFNNTTESIIMTDEKFHIISVNKAFEENLGYTSKEIMGKKPNFLRPRGGDGTRYEKMDKALKEKGRFSGELLVATKQGTLIPELVNASSIKNDQGEVINYFAIYQSIVQQKETENKLKKMAQYDNLTKLPNRFLFRFRLLNAFERMEQSDMKTALVFVDLDDFKNVNDTLGHDAGDIVLVQTAKKISESIRKNDTVARLGGDEFVIILEDIQNLENLKRICQKIITNLHQPFPLLGTTYRISASLGVSISPDHTKNYRELLKFADKAMYQAKNKGKNTIVFYKS